MPEYYEPSLESLPSFGANYNEDVSEFLDELYRKCGDPDGATLRARLVGKAKEWLNKFEWVRDEFDFDKLEDELVERFRMKSAKEDHYVEYRTLKQTPDMSVSRCAELVFNATYKFAGVSPNDRRPRPMWLEDVLLNKFVHTVNPEIWNELTNGKIRDFDQVVERAKRIEIVHQKQNSIKKKQNKQTELRKVTIKPQNETMEFPQDIEKLQNGKMQLLLEIEKLQNRKTELSQETERLRNEQTEIREEIEKPQKGKTEICEGTEKPPKEKTEISQETKKHQNEQPKIFQDSKYQNNQTQIPQGTENIEKHRGNFLLSKMQTTENCGAKRTKKMKTKPQKNNVQELKTTIELGNNNKRSRSEEKGPFDDCTKMKENDTHAGKIVRNMTGKYDGTKFKDKQKRKKFENQKGQKTSKQKCQKPWKQDEKCQKPAKIWKGENVHINLNERNDLHAKMRDEYHMQNGNPKRKKNMHIFPPWYKRPPQRPEREREKRDFQK